MQISRSQDEQSYLIRAIDAFQRKIVVIDANHKILSANQQAFDVFEKNIIGKTCYQAFHNFSSPCKDCPLDKVMRTQKPALKESQALDLMNETCRYFCPMNSEEIIDGVVLLDFGIPILEGLEEKLQQSNAFLKNLILSSVDAVLAVDKQGRILIFNEAAAEITGYNQEEALNMVDIRDVYPNNGAREIMRALRAEEYGGPGKLKGYKVDIIHRNGEVIPISVNAALVYDGDREVASIGFFKDLREDIRIKDELEKAQVQILQSEKMASLGKLAAGVAHQLNNPLGGITLFTKLVLEEYDLEEAARDDLSRILRDAERCRDTVKELLEFARQTRHLMRPNDINRAISRTLFLLENQTIFHNIDIIRQLAPALPPVHSDVQQLNHVFMNIILNAADAMAGKGSLTVTTGLSESKNHVIIQIQDTGPGIPDDVLPHIFEPFFTTKEEGKGTGLGLSLVYGIVQNHGGKIEANTSSTGTRFTIKLPIRQE
ncbi:MAG: PAS/PAC sensor signal transduction histidine kinase [Candidatus Magnetoglobus multicellularis str. Araruama]|uniref:histidine kinase n=1 Tax=Candidatus Magnetoglobus multicellularis str. Araruama TaxID=890399 RepID=A0A1V1PEW1_9BACT|nr:MAG: PAS/PAC sensor signal transduction histidine kinase [Candidatus Magnetoglobus multicellularis str. Araruama]